MYTFAIESPVGFWMVTTSETHVLAVDYVDEQPDNISTEATDRLGMRVQCMLSRYFKGEVIDFSTLPILFPPPANPKASHLLARVMERILQIPYGEAYSYQWLAGELGMPQAPRAMGGALGRNPIPIIVPCHRIIAKHGKLGGFMKDFAKGSAIKTFLLELEGHRVIDKQVISVSQKSLWDVALPELSAATLNS